MEKLTWDGLFTALSATLIPLFVLFITIFYQKKQIRAEKTRKKKVLLKIISINLRNLTNAIISFRKYVDDTNKKIAIDNISNIVTQEPIDVSADVLREIGYHTIFDALENHISSKKAKSFNDMWEGLNTFSVTVKSTNGHFAQLIRRYVEIQHDFKNQTHDFFNLLKAIINKNDVKFRDQITAVTHIYNASPNKQALSVITSGYIAPIQDFIISHKLNNQEEFAELNKLGEKAIYTYDILEQMVSEYKSIFSSTSSTLLIAESKLNTFLNDIMHESKL